MVFFSNLLKKELWNRSPHTKQGMGISHSMKCVAISPQLLERGGEGDNGSGIIVLTSIIPAIFVVENREKYSIQKLIGMQALSV